jgi:hypothetical protein
VAIDGQQKKLAVELTKRTPRDVRIGLDSLQQLEIVVF